MKRSPAETEKSAKLVTRRGLLLGAAQLAFAGVLVARMRFMQLEQAD